MKISISNNKMTKIEQIIFNRMVKSFTNSPISQPFDVTSGKHNKNLRV